MNKLISRNKLLFGCLAVMALLPASKLFADYAWIATPSIYKSCTSDSYYEGNHLTCEVDASLYRTSDLWYANSSGFYMPYYLKAFSDVWMWSMGDEYSNEIDVIAESEVQFQVDWDWNGPPATAPGADVYLDIILDSTQDSNSGYFDPNDAATSYAEGCCISWGANGAWDEGDCGTIGCAGYISEWVDEGDSHLEDDFYLDDPDNYNWYEYTESENLCHAGVNWDYDNYIDYEVSSGLGWFSALGWGYCYAHSYVDFDYDGGGGGVDALSTQSAELYIDAYCLMTSN